MGFFKGANHFGIAGYYSMKAAKQGLIVSFFRTLVQEGRKEDIRICNYIKDTPVLGRIAPVVTSLIIFSSFLGKKSAQKFNHRVVKNCLRCKCVFGPSENHTLGPKVKKWQNV